MWKYLAKEYDWIDGDMSSIQRDFLPDDFKREIDRAGVAGSVAVQARQTVEETRWLLDVAREYSFIQGVIGWVPLADPNLPACLAELVVHPKLKGIRHVLQQELDEQWILSSAFHRGIQMLRGTSLVYDLLVIERQLPQAIDLVDRHPNQIFVLDHLAKPLIASGVTEPWARRLRELAERENVFCKLSGLATEANWKRQPSVDTHAALRPYLDVAVEAFTPERLMVGSDWPVCLLATSYTGWFTLLDEYFAQFSSLERGAVFGANATRVYHLDLNWA